MHDSVKVTTVDLETKRQVVNTTWASKTATSSVHAWNRVVTLLAEMVTVASLCASHMRLRLRRTRILNAD